MNLDELTGRVALGREHQARAVRATLEALLVRKQGGFILADEVGCGKTFEALTSAALLDVALRERDGVDKGLRRVLIAVPPPLVTKWHDEIEAPPETPEKRGFPQYLKHPSLQPFGNALRKVHQINARHAGPTRGTNEDGRQVQPGVYIANANLLHDDHDARASATVKYLRKTKWDLVIVDEAHRYTNAGNKRGQLFFPDGDVQRRDEGLRARFVLALTATPFQLSIRELLNLFRIVAAPEADVERLGTGLTQFERGLESFYSKRALPPEHEARARAVSQLAKLRLENCGAGEGLEPLMRRYMARNAKPAGGRTYAITNRELDGYVPRPFAKLDDLRRTLRESPLVPLMGDDAYVYLELRDLVADSFTDARRDEAARPTFVAGDLRQALSSYEQLLESSLLAKGGERTASLKRRLASMPVVDSMRSHPKSEALVAVVDELVKRELAACADDARRMPHKILIFNTLMKTAAALRGRLEAVVSKRVLEFLDEQVLLAGFESREGLADQVRRLLEDERQDVRLMLEEKHGRFLEVPKEFFEEVSESKAERLNLVDLVYDRARRHCVQPLFLLSVAMHCRNGGDTSDETIMTFLARHLSKELRQRVDRLVDDYLDDTPAIESANENDNFERGRREFGRIMRSLSAPEFVGRYDGETSAERERHRECFNHPYAPLVLLVSQVGEEGIDLQQHTRYVLHYDVEWNPAKMEQREGRVDREGRKDTQPVQVQFFLLKDTYEERIFHTVMQRDAWFSILIGSKTKDLARNAGEANDEQENDAALVGEGNQLLSVVEREAVMLELSP